MIKTILACIFAAFCVAACGGSGGSDSQPASKAMTISMYGKPLVSGASTATAHAQLNAVANAASAPATGASDAQATVQTLTEALTARGVTADITPQVMDGTTLHQIVMGENNGLPPTPDQFKTDPSEWMVVNFQLDDMVTPASDPAQQAALAQFTQDLIVFSQRAAVSGKAVLAVLPIQTCDTENSAALGLYSAMNQAFINGAALRFIGQTGVSFGFDSVGKVIEDSNTAHMGADCRTPDAYLQNLQIQSIADTLAAIYKEATAAASAASGASTTGT